ncbi:MAG: cation diffusion facilitator family transporter [Candidatus Diapherotrites archaeon]|nr:cation diffusion facilitator family transporter [Candidatus Diapherotrites archaeon]
MGSTGDGSIRDGEKAAAVASAIALGLALLKGVIGILSGSLALVSDALHSLTDLVSSLASWFAIRLAHKKPDKRFPYGYYKAENLATLVIAAFIIYAAVELLLRGAEALHTIVILKIPIYAMGTAALSVLVSYLISAYLARAGKKQNSPSLLAASSERRVDALSSAAVFLAILLTYYKVPYADAAISILVSLLVLRVGLIILKDAVFALMDVSPSRELEESVRKLIAKVRGVEKVSELRLRKSGAVVFGEVVIKVESSIDVYRAHAIADEIEGKIKREFKEIGFFTVHVEPFKRTKQLLVVPVGEGSLDSKVTNNFARASYFVFAEVKKNKLVKTWVKENKFKQKEVRAGLSVSHWLLEKRVTAIVTKQIGEISFHTLRDHLVEVYEVNGDTAREVINNFISGKVKPLEKPTMEKE